MTSDIQTHTHRRIIQMARGYGKGGNSSGRGPVGKAPASRAPIKAAVKPTSGGTRNPNAAGGNPRTGGGEGSAKHIKRNPVVGSAQTRKTNPATAGDFGRAVGNHVMGSANGGNTTRHDPPLHVPAQAPSRMGNDKALEVGRGGPGTGRTVHAKGSQAYYGNAENHPGTINADRSISPPGSNQGSSVPTRPMGSPQGGGGPGGFGFTGKR
jgi:hypothetical protein